MTRDTSPSTTATRGPRSRLLPALALAVAWGATLLAAAPAHAVLLAIEQAFETTSADTKLPEAPGRFTPPQCGKGCPAVLELTAATTYTVRQRPVTLKALRDYLAQKPGTMTLYFDPKTGIVNRVSAD
jgi:hypothetical protein